MNPTNSVQFFICLRADITVQRQITKKARVKRRRRRETGKTNIHKKQKTKSGQ